MQSSTCYNWARAAVAVVLMGAAALAPDGVGVLAQSLKQTQKPLKISGIVGKDTVNIGDVETYRAIVNQTRDVEFRWDAAGRTELGNPVVHRFQTAGTFEVIVTARNRVSTASDTMTITVLGPPAPPPVAAAAKPAEAKPSGDEAKAKAKAKDEADAKKEAASEPTAMAAAEPPSPAATRAGFRGKEHVSETDDGYTWVIATYFERASAVALANSYRASGYRVGVIADNEGQGTQVFRVILGAFDTQQSALNAKRYLVNAGYQNIMLRELNRKG